MERLTEEINGRAICEVECKGYNDDCECEHLHKMIEKLAGYEDLEEQGLLLRLPCKVGDTVYVLEEEWLEMYEPSSRVYEIEESKFEIWMFEEIGRWVFLTKAEAEKALAEMEK